MSGLEFLYLIWSKIPVYYLWFDNNRIRMSSFSAQEVSTAMQINEIFSIMGGRHQCRPSSRLKRRCASYTTSLSELCWLPRTLPSVSILNLHRKVKHKVSFRELSWIVKMESQSNCDPILSHSNLQNAFNLEFKTFKVTYFQRSASSFCFKIYILVQIPELRQSDFKLLYLRYKM